MLQLMIVQDGWVVVLCRRLVRLVVTFVAVLWNFFKSWSLMQTLLKELFVVRTIGDMLGWPYSSMWGVSLIELHVGSTDLQFVLHLLQPGRNHLRVKLNLLVLLGLPSDEVEVEVLADSIFLFVDVVAQL